MKKERLLARVRAACTVAALVALSAAGAAAEEHGADTGAPVLQSVTAATQGGTQVLRVQFSRALSALPTGFAIQSPPRIVLDLDGVTSGLQDSRVALDQGNFRSARVVGAKDRTRLVLYLKTAAAWKARQDGNTLLVVLDPGAVAGASVRAPESAATGATPQPATSGSVKDLDFRRSADGAGRILLDLANGEMAVDTRVQGQDLVIEVLKASLPQGLRRRMDVTDFGTAVQTITSTQVGDRVRIVIEPKGQWEHSAYQSDNHFVVEVRPLKVDADKPGAGAGYTGEKLSLNFQSIDVRSLLQVIADFTNFNIVTSDSVSGSVTLRLKDVPWDQALDVILQARNLGMRRGGNVLWVAPKDEIAAKEKAELEARAAIQVLEPVRTQWYQLNYSKAADVSAQLTGGTATGRILSTRGSVMAEPRTNQVFVTDIPSRLEAVQQLISRIDVPVRQVLIEARIVEASETFGKALGAKLGVASTGSNYAFGNSYDAVSAASGQSTAVTTSTPFVNLPSAGVGGFSAATFAVSLFNAGASRFLNLELSALESEGKGKLVSSPRIMAANQSKATIEQGTEFPYQQATSSGATSVSFRKATLKLEVTPQITPDGKVILDLDINKDSRGADTAAGVAIDTKHIVTQALVENGGTVVIGGIFELTDTDSKTKVPVLGDLPGLGYLFRNDTLERDKQEMLIFITPHIAEDGRGAVARGK